MADPIQQTIPPTTPTPPTPPTTPEPNASAPVNPPAQQTSQTPTPTPAPTQQSKPAFDPNKPYQPATAPNPLDTAISEAGRLGGPLGSALISATAGAHAANVSQQQSKPAFDPSKPYQSAANSEQPDMLDRAVTGVGQSLENNFVNPVKDMLRPPEDHKEALALTFGGPEGLEAYRAARQVAGSVENIVKAPKENFNQATQDFAQGVREFQKGNYRDAIASAGSTSADLMGVLPGPGAIVGPRFRELTEGAKSGGDLVTPLAKDLTDLATLWASEKAPEIAQGLKKVATAPKDFVVGRLTPEEAATVPASAKFQPATDLTPQDVLTHAEQEGVDLTPGEAIKTKPRQAIQGLGERAFVGGQGLEDQIQTSRQALTDSVSNFADTHDPQNLGTSEESAGDALQKSAQAAKDAAHDAAQDAYKNLPAKLQNARVDVSDIRTKWQQIAKDEQIAIRNLPPEIGNKLQSVIDRGTQIGTPLPDGTIAPKVSFADAAKLRSAFREMGDTVGADLPARYQGMFKGLTEDLDTAMQRTANNTGYTNAWRQANAGWKDYSDTFGDRQSPLYRILNQTDPAKITRDLLNRASAADVETLDHAGIDLAPLKRQAITDIANAGYRVGREGLAGYSDSFLDALFGPAKRELYLKSELGRRLGFEVNPSGTSNVLAAEMQIPTNKEGLIKGIAGSAGAAKISKTRPATSYLPRVNTPSNVPRLSAATAALMARVPEKHVGFVDSQGEAHSIEDTPENRAAVLKEDPQAQFVEPQQ